MSPPYLGVVGTAVTSGTNGPPVTDSNGVSKIEDEIMKFASPIKNKADEDSPIALMFPTLIS